VSGLYFLLPALLAVFVSFLVVRAAAIALRMTGMDHERAVFQALSAFSGTGFTTREAERVINHPARRRIIVWLMILGNAGIVTVIIAATSSIVRSEGYGIALDVALLAAGVFVIYKVAAHRGFVRRWERYMERRLAGHELLEEEAVEDLLHLIEGYGLVRAVIAADSALAGRPLSGCAACGEHVVVLGIERGREWLSVPPADEVLRAGDRLVVYGRLAALRALFDAEGAREEA
jgi:hypothetical protein